MHIYLQTLMSWNRTSTFICFNPWTWSYPGVLALPLAIHQDNLRRCSRVACNPWRMPCGRGKAWLTANPVSNGQNCPGSRSRCPLTMLREWCSRPASRNQSAPYHKSYRRRYKARMEHSRRCSWSPCALLSSDYPLPRPGLSNRWVLENLSLWFRTTAGSDHLAHECRISESRSGYRGW